jgi:hypothetical protein
MRLIGGLILCVIGAAPASAQVLPLGGFDVRLTSSFDSTARQLSAVYELQSLDLVHSESRGKLWWVRRRDPGRTILGTLEEKDGRIVGIVRDWTGGTDQISGAFVSFWEEARRLGGNDCVTTPSFLLPSGSNESAHLGSYSTKCGRFVIEHGMAWPAQRMQERLTLSLR